MKIPIYQVDAFATAVFEGNPAAVCPLKQWLDDETLQQIAMENNLSETAFFVEQDDSYRLRWFTPTTEVDLCGHATLASAHVLFEHMGYMGYDKEVICFDSNSGDLKVRKEGERILLDFPASDLHPADPPDFLEEAIALRVEELYRDTDYLYVVETENQVRGLDPDIGLLKKADVRGIIVTAPANSANDYDFVSRFFGPAVGVDEDPVTGSAHTMLAPYWSRRYGKDELVGRQVSRRGGTVYCKNKEGRVELGGTARTFLQGEITI